MPYHHHHHHHHHFHLQVELNTIASSFGCLSALMTRLHTYTASRLPQLVGGGWWMGWGWWGLWGWRWGEVCYGGWKGGGGSGVWHPAMGAPPWGGGGIGRCWVCGGGGCLRRVFVGAGASTVGSADCQPPCAEPGGRQATSDFTAACSCMP